MTKKSFIITILILCIGLIMMGCPKKTVVKEEPSVKKEEAAKIEAAKKEEAAKREEKEFEKSLIAKKEPGIEGVVFESSLLKDVHFDFDKYDIRPGGDRVFRKRIIRVDVDHRQKEPGPDKRACFIRTVNRESSNRRGLSKDWIRCVGIHRQFRAFDLETAIDRQN